MKKGQTPNPAVIKKPEIKTKQIRQKALPAASLPRRFLAAAVDWYGSALCGNLIITLVVSLAQGQLLVTSSIADLSSGLAMTAAQKIVEEKAGQMKDNQSIYDEFLEEVGEDAHGSDTEK